MLPFLIDISESTATCIEFEFLEGTPTYVRS